MSLQKRAVELTKNQRAIAGFTKFVVGVIIFGVAAYSDIQFILIMQKAFPDGIAKIFSLIGAVATGMSVLALVVAEAYWFSRGPQMVFGWLFTAMEVIVSVLNVILSFEMSSHAVLDPFMATWLVIVPATPFVAFVGWIVVLNLDEEQHARHEEREMQDDLAGAQREHTKAVHTSKMKLKTRYLESTTTYLDQIADDPQVQAGLRMGAWKFAAEELRALTGMYIPIQGQHNGLPQPTIVDENPPTQKATEPTQKQSWKPFAGLAKLFAGDEPVQAPSTHMYPNAGKSETPAPSYPFLPTTPRYISTETPIIVVPPFYPAPNQSGNGANQNGNSQK